MHPLRAMSKMQSGTEMCVALLHDVIENSDLTATDLLTAGMTKPVVDAVLALTKAESQSYDDFIEQVAVNPLARKVKLADIEDNINLLRLETVSEKDLQRVAKYHHAWKRLHALDQ